jgi:hypothetical protein
MKVIKSTGEEEKFIPKKIYKSVRDAGGSTKLAKEASDFIKKQYHKKITTKEILESLIKFLKKEPGVSERYDLKRAIMSLGPSGFPFENFFSSVLQYYGFKTKTGSKVKGKSVYHEIDIIAEKNKKFMIECKYRNQKEGIVKLKPALYTYARFLDIKKHGFDQSWLVTNTRCSTDAKKYSNGVNQKITSWKYPEKESLQKLIEKPKLYPITILKNLKNETKEKLYESKILIAKDLLNYSLKELKQKTHLPEEEIKKILVEVKEVCQIQ